VLPELLPTRLGDAIKQMLDAPFYTAVVCLGFLTASRVTEQVRASIQPLPRGQRMAGQNSRREFAY
jgi:glutamate/aspartate transport system permease protein